MKPWRRQLFVLATAAAVSACDGLGSAASGQESWRTDFTKHTVPLEEIVSGGPPKDGIPAIDNPAFVSIRSADDWLEDGEPVAVVRLDGETKAYPLQILIHHEIVNDRVGSTPVSVTYCPLCNTTLAFDRRFDGPVLDFGTTGRLRHSDLVMYDRQTETWWQQATGDAVVGRYAGEKLTFLAAPVLAWRDVKAEHPDARVLSRETGHRRDYGVNPYVGYDTRQGPYPQFFMGPTDGRMPLMERIVAVERGGESIALPFSRLEEARVAHVDVAGEDLVVLWAPGTASPVDGPRVASGRDVGSTGVYARELDGRLLTFRPHGQGRFRDEETGSTWTLSGRAVEGALRGRALTVVPHGNHFWFAWAVFRPQTEVWEG